MVFIGIYNIYYLYYIIIIYWYLCKRFVFIQKIFAMTNTENVSEFNGALREFHYLQKTWQPKEAEEINYFHELDNALDAYAIKLLIMVLLSDIFIEKYQD